jgi:hypothetical protein
MAIIRLIIAGAIALFAVVATLFAALVVFATGLVALVIQRFRGKQPPAGPARPQPARAAMQPEGAIDVVATQVPDKH